MQRKTKIWIGVGVVVVIAAGADSSNDPDELPVQTTVEATESVSTESEAAETETGECTKISKSALHEMINDSDTRRQGVAKIEEAFTAKSDDYPDPTNTALFDKEVWMVAGVTGDRIAVWASTSDPTDDPFDPGLTFPMNGVARKFSILGVDVPRDVVPQMGEDGVTEVLLCARGD